MKPSILTLALTTLFSSATTNALAQKKWIDITEEYITNPSFVGNSSKGWTYTSNASSQTLRCESMEFWNGTFDIHQTTPNLKPGHYRLSVNAYYRCRDNDNGYTQHQNKSEDITAYVYAGNTEQKMLCIYDWSKSNDFYGGNTWSPNWIRPQIWFPNTMESATAAFSLGGYHNEMEFDHQGGELTLGLCNNVFVNNNWCIFDDFKLEYFGDVTPITAITLNGAEKSLILGESRQLSVGITPADATIKKLVWLSSNPDVVSVDDNGRVTALAEGSATITATSTDGSGVQGTVRISVERNQATAGSLVINEIMAANIDEFVSPAFNFDGWIELYNPTDRNVELGDLYFSDDNTNLKQWHTPATMGTVPAKGYATVWFDSNILNINNCPFKLDTDGGNLYISNANGDILAEAKYPAALERVSYARTTDGGEEWGLTGTPTPAASNAKAVFATEQLAAPAIDLGSQLFTGNLAVQVTIPEGTTLRYTTDGSLPTLTNGKTSADGRLTINSTTNLRCRLFADGKIASPVTSRSYIYKDRNYNLPVVSVVGDDRFFYDDSIGVYVRGVNGRPGNGQSSPCNWNMDWERPVNFSYITPDNQMVLNQDVNLEMCGGWSRSWEPHSFKLKGNKELGGNKNLNYPFFAAKPYIRNRTLQIRNGGNDTQCRIKDAALQTIIQSSGIDIDGQSYQPVHEFVNGKYIGVLNIREPNNKHFVYANYGWDDDEIDQFEMSPDSGYVQSCGTDVAFNTLYTLSAQADNANTYEEIKKLLDIDEYANYMAAEFYLGGTDWPQNNVKGYRPNDGRFRFVTFDLDGTFATGNAFNDFANKQIYTFDKLYGQPVERITDEIKMVTIFRNMLKNDEFRKKFVDTYCLMGGSVFEPTRSTAIIDSLTAIVAPEMAFRNESPMYTANDIKNNLNGRLSVALNQMYGFPELKVSRGSGQDISLSSNVDGAALYVNDIPVPTGRFNGTLFAPMTLRAEAPAGYTFKGWKDASAGMNTLIANGAAWDYYDQGSLDNSGWTTRGDGKTWKNGNAPLGYAKDGLKTVLDFGGDNSNKRPTYYFRSNVTLTDAPKSGDVFRLDYTVDDGFIIYVNGKVAGRYNCDRDGYNSYSNTYANGNPDRGSINLPASLFQKGSNTIAVEVHNNSAGSSDIYWDAQLNTTMNTTASADYISTQAEIALPAGVSSLVADYEPIENAADSGYVPVRINEISAANEIFVNDYGKKGDWVELYNTTSEPQDVEGMYLSDDLKKPTKSKISKGKTHANTVIPAHGYLVIWCDKKNTSRDLHASFKLADEGSTLILTSADKSWNDTLSYQAHDGWHTVGRYNDGGNDIYLMSQPTIGKHNMKTSYNEFVMRQHEPDATGIASVAATTGKTLTVSAASGQVIVRGQAAQVELQIFTLSGQKVATAQINMNGGLGIFQASALENGYYVAKVTDGKHTAVCKFVK